MSCARAPYLDSFEFLRAFAYQLRREQENEFKKSVEEASSLRVNARIY